MGLCFLCCQSLLHLPVSLVYGLGDVYKRQEDELVRNGIAIAVLFIATLIVGAIVNFVIGQLVEKTGLSGTDRVLGVCFGALRGVLIVAAILFFLDSFTGVSKSEDWSKSQLIPQFSFIIRWFFDYLQSSSSFLPRA